MVNKSVLDCLMYNNRNMIRSENRALLVLFGIWITSVLGGLGLSIGIIYAAVHFIHKYW